MLPGWPDDRRFMFFVSSLTNIYIFLWIYVWINVVVHFRSIESAVSALSKPCVWGLILEQLAPVRLTDRLKRRQTDRQQEEKEGKGRLLRKLTICGLHDTGVVVVAPGNASHRGHLGPLRVTRGAFRQPRHIGGRWVVICSERGCWELKGRLSDAAWAQVTK